MEINQLASQRFKASEDHLFTEIKGEGVILSLKSGKYYGVNDVGKSIWSAIQQPATIAQIQLAIKQEFEVDDDTSRRDIANFLESMIGENLVEVVYDEGS